MQASTALGLNSALYLRRWRPAAASTKLVSVCPRKVKRTPDSYISTFKSICLRWLLTLHERYNNDETGAPAYDPAVLLKIVLLAYSRGLILSRNIERACRENVLFMGLSGDLRQISAASPPSIPENRPALQRVAPVAQVCLFLRSK